MTDPRNAPESGDADGFDSDPFFELGLAPTIVDDAAAAGLIKPTPIQTQAIPAMLEGRDLIGLAQTGTGKTAAFLLPLLHQQLERKKAKDVRRTNTLILAPTRELAYQIAESLKTLSASLKLRYLVVCGGERYDHQIRSLKKGVDMIIATPGRLEDLQARGAVKLQDIAHFVLDEGDQMIDLGFYPAIKRILSMLPETRQTVLFSATMPAEMKTLAEGFLSDPLTVKVENAGKTVDTVSQRAVLAQNVDKRDLLLRELQTIDDGQVLVFVRTRMRADQLAEWLGKQGVGVDALHGDMRQYIRQKVIRKFKSGALQVLVATDVAARGIDMSGLRLVINFDLPETVDTYIHRIGRTGRAGRKGEALSICAVVDQEKLGAILAQVGQRLAITDGDGNSVEDFVPERAPRARKGRGRPPRNQRTGQRAGQRTGPRNGQRAGHRTGSPNEQRDDDRPQRARVGKAGAKPFKDAADAPKKTKSPQAKPAKGKPAKGKPYKDKPHRETFDGDKSRGPKSNGGKFRKDKSSGGKSPQRKPREDAAFQAGAHQAADKKPRADRSTVSGGKQDQPSARQTLTKARLNKSRRPGSKPHGKAGSGAGDKAAPRPAKKIRPFRKSTGAPQRGRGGEGRLRRRNAG